MAVIPLYNSRVITTVADNAPIRAELNTKTGELIMTADNLMAHSPKKLTSAQIILSALQEAGITPASIDPSPMSPTFPKGGTGIISGGQGTITIAGKDALAAAMALGFESGVLHTIEPVVAEVVTSSEITPWRHKVMRQGDLALVPSRDSR